MKLVLLLFNRNYFLLGLFLLPVFIALPYSLNAQSSNPQYLKKLAVQDLEYLSEAIKNTHPFPFTYTSEQEFNQLIDNEIDQFKDTVDYFTLRNAARKIVYYVHCVHTTVLSRNISTRESLNISNKYFPVEIKWIGNDFFVFKNYLNDKTIKPGYKLKSINGYPMSIIVDSIKTYRSGDGPEDDFIRGLINLPFQFNFLYDLHFPEDSIYVVEYLDFSNTNCYDTLVAIYEPYNNLKEKDTIQYDYIDRYKKLKFRFLEPYVGYLQINDFDGFQDYHYHYIFKLMEENKTTDLIIDLRYNYGGVMDNANNLLSYIIDTLSSFSLVTPMKKKEFYYYDESGMFQRLAGIFYFMLMDKGTYSIREGNWYWKSFIEPRKHYNFNGNVYILINEHTLSAASYLASQLKHRTGAILVGSPSGGGEFGNAGYTYTSFTLPNSNSKIKVPHNWINYDIDFTVNHGLYPQYIIQPQINDLLNGKDVVLEKTLEIIKN